MGLSVGSVPGRYDDAVVDGSLSGCCHLRNQPGSSRTESPLCRLPVDQRASPFATIMEGSNVILFSERGTPPADGPKAPDPCSWCRLLQTWGVGLEERQFRNWNGSGKVASPMSENVRLFDWQNLMEVADRYLGSDGRSPSLYEVSSGRITREDINTGQYAEIWDCSRRQAQRIIGSGAMEWRKVGNEFFIPKEAGEAYTRYFSEAACSKGSGVYSYETSKRSAGERLLESTSMPPGMTTPTRASIASW